MSRQIKPSILYGIRSENLNCLWQASEVYFFLLIVLTVENALSLRNCRGRIPVWPRADQLVAPCQVCTAHCTLHTAQWSYTCHTTVWTSHGPPHHTTPKILYTGSDPALAQCSSDRETVNMLHANMPSCQLFTHCHINVTCHTLRRSHLVIYIWNHIKTDFYTLYTLPLCHF